jgi:hypothetical protein
LRQIVSGEPIPNEREEQTQHAKEKESVVLKVQIKVDRKPVQIGLVKVISF